VKGQKLVPLLVVAAGLLAYHNSLVGALVFDDLPSISENPHIRQLWPLWDVLSHSSRPVVHLSLAVNYALGGINPWGYHLFNVAVHILVALTLYGVVRRTFRSETLRSTFGQAGSWLAGAITLIWLVHPLHTEGVTYTIQRCESLMSLFYLLTLYCVIRSDDASRENLWKIGAVVSCALGMACKPVMVTAPLVTLLYDRVFLGKSWRDIMPRRGWLYAGLAASWLLLPPLLANAPTEWNASAGFEFKGIPPLQYALMQSVVIVRYLRLAFWPHPLCLDYGWQYHWQEMVQAGDVLPDLMVVAALLAGTVWAWNRKPSLGFLGAWFFLILAPTSSLIPVADPIEEYRMYLPLAAVVTGAVVVAFVLGKRILSKQSGFVLGWVACGFVVVPLAVLTIQRNRDYISGVVIWQDTVAKCPQNPRAHYNLGVDLTPAGRIPEAFEHYEQALRIKPDYGEAHNNLGILLQKSGRETEAIEHYERSLQIDPKNAKAHSNLGSVFLQEGKVSDAEREFEQALRLNPDDAITHRNLGVALAQAGRVGEAIGHYEQALRIQPDYAAAHSNLGIALARVGRTQEAMEHYEQALRIQPDLAEAHCSLGVALAQAGRVGEAIGHYEQALRIQPDSVEAHHNLGIALFQLGRLPEAMGHWEQALRIKPDLAGAHYYLGLALARLGRLQDAIGHYEQALRIKPDSAEAHYNLGIALLQLGRLPEAIGHWEQALRIKPDYAEAENNLAWLLATLAPTDGGAPVRAVTLAERACKLTNNRVTPYLDTLAAAYAAVGRSNEAIATAQKAIELAKAAGQSQLVEQIELHLKLYRSGQPYHQPIDLKNPPKP
jgi:tetratricopeptide (TPR) repeat protein